MPVFKYVATDTIGSKITGTYDAGNEQEVHIYLKRNNLQPVSVKRSFLHADFSFGKEKVKPKELIVFIRMFAAMSKAAIPADQALKVLHRQTGSKPLKRAIQRMIIDVEGGDSLSEAMRTQTDVWDKLMVNMVAAGEVSGKLDTMLVRLGDLIEKDAAIKAKVKGAMIYPAVLLCVAAGAVGILLTFVLPQFIDVFIQSGVKLPLPTRIAMAMSKFLSSYWWTLLLGAVGTVVGIKQARKHPRAERVFDRMAIRMKVLGPVITKGAVARFTRTLSTLVSSGVPIIDGLDLTAETAGNSVITDAILAARDSISAGSNIADPLAASGVFPDMATSMIAIGEQAGELDLMLEQVADFYETDVNRTVDTALKLIEPLMLVVLGSLVGGIMASLYLPLFDMITAMGNDEAASSAADSVAE